LFGFVLGGGLLRLYLAEGSDGFERTGGQLGLGRTDGRLLLLAPHRKLELEE
jgi:hypothetical protein